ncbi:hypothetical protein EGH21_12715 [Halomicroarcula sp. F13]|uniref:Uncharacterized protein n=1 Tax=Haloarcula rubra TaxID=2487747 RepID=A0AAW4PU38_9EURY|nr:hypothetical protein [Halomicroarcula rubra]MBX0323893.1 hypothetical protein [Halomicroarcula rubra]
MSRATTPDRIEREKVEGKQATAYFYHTDPDYTARIEVEREERWEFGIDDKAVATLLTTTDVADDLLVEPDIPEWLVESLHGFGIEEVEA